MRARAKKEEESVRREERRLAAMTEQEAKRKKMLEEQQELERIGLEAEVVVRTECLPWCECVRWHLCFVPLSCVLLWAGRKEPSSKVAGRDLFVAMHVCDDDAAWSHRLLAPQRKRLELAEQRRQLEQASHRLLFLSFNAHACLHVGTWDQESCTQPG